MASTEVFIVHDVELVALLLELDNRRIRVVEKQRMAVAPSLADGTSRSCVSVLIEEPITRRLHDNIKKKVAAAGRAAQGWLEMNPRRRSV
jgi:hypothetical protein